MRSLFLLSSLMAKFWALVRLGLGGWEDLSTQFILALSSSASCWLNLVQAASMAVIYSKLGGCLGVPAKLGPLASRDLCAGVKGLLERFITHFGLGSSEGEEPCGVWCLLEEDPASWEALSWGNTPWGTAVSHWETLLISLEELPACLALSLAEHLTAWGGVVLSACRVPSSGEEGELPWKSSLSAGERVLSSREAWELPAWEISLSAGERVLSTGETWELPA